MSFPDFGKVAYAFGLPYYRIGSEEDAKTILPKALDAKGPVMIEAVVDENQNFEPKLSSAANDDMFPFLTNEEY